MGLPLERAVSHSVGEISTSGLAESAQDGEGSGGERPSGSEHDAEVSLLSICCPCHPNALTV